MLELGSPEVSDAFRELPPGNQAFMRSTLEHVPMIDLLRNNTLDNYFNPEFASNQSQLVNSMFDEIARRAPSSYGEVKRYGPMGVNADNFPAVIRNAGKSWDETDAMIGAAGQYQRQQALRELEGRGLQIYDGTDMSRAELHELIQDIQTNALRGTLGKLRHRYGRID